MRSGVPSPFMSAVALRGPRGVPSDEAGAGDTKSGPVQATC